MTQPAKINFKLYQGSTFLETLRWESEEKMYVPISGITKSAPIEISALAHGIPLNWRVKVTNVTGMKEINSTDTYHRVTEISTNSFKINAINAVSYSDYISGGIVEYNKPTNLTGMTARMQIRLKLDSSDFISELTTENGGIVIDNTLKTITIQIPAAVTTAFSFSSAVYSLELVSSGGIVYPFANGSITLVKEVTR